MTMLNKQRESRAESVAVAPPLLLPAGYETSILLPKLTSERSLLPYLIGGCLPFTPAAAALEVLSGFVRFYQVLFEEGERKVHRGRGEKN